MLIEPASKVSVPFTVVMRTLSRTPDKAIEPPNEAIELSLVLPTVPKPVHVLLEMLVNINEP